MMNTVTNIMTLIDIRQDTNQISDTSRKTKSNTSYREDLNLKFYPASLVNSRPAKTYINIYISIKINVFHDSQFSLPHVRQLKDIEKQILN